MMQAMTKKDIQVLRELAKRQQEIANTPRMLQLTEDWYRHNDLKGEKPLIVVEAWTFQQDIPLEPQRCETEPAREAERRFLITLANHKWIPDDQVVPPSFCLGVPTRFRPFGLDVKKHELTGSVGHQFVHQINDLEEDFHLLGLSTWDSPGMASVLERKAALEAAFGDILPVEVIGHGLYSVPTQDLVHIMGMENMMMGMLDYPELFHRMMDRLSDDYVAYHKWMETEGLLLPTVSYGGVGNGTFAFTRRLPAQGPVTVGQVWGFMDSQETVGFSPASFEEFIFPYYKKVAEKYGLLSYGCCEPVDPIFDSCLSKLDNLAKVSISPWCNEDVMGERLRGSKTIYHRKPSPNFLGVGYELDEAGWRAHIEKTLQAAKGCKVEIAQRDVYTVGGNLPKIARFIEIVREAIETHWEG
jgi:hypothetical protein